MASKGITYKPTEADRLFVHRASMAGRNHEVIAATLNITAKTLRKHYKYELMTAREMLISSSVQCLSDAVNNGNVDAAKYILSRQGGWTEPKETGSGDADMVQAMLKIADRLPG